MSARILVVVPCGARKIWDRFPERKATRAEEAYIGAPFKLNKAFAKKFGHRWMILSAKYGFIDPNFEIPENYNVSFNDRRTRPLGLNLLKTQMKRKDLENFDMVIALGGKNYTGIVKQVFLNCAKVVAPTEGLPIGRAMSLVKELIKLDKAQLLGKIA